MRTTQTEMSLMCKALGMDGPKVHQRSLPFDTCANLTVVLVQLCKLCCIRQMARSSGMLCHMDELHLVCKPVVASKAVPHPICSRAGRYQGVCRLKLLSGHSCHLDVSDRREGQSTEKPDLSTETIPKGWMQAAGLGFSGASWVLRCIGDADLRCGQL